jgi:hypothetical protein
MLGINNALEYPINGIQAKLIGQDGIGQAIR